MAKKRPIPGEERTKEFLRLAHERFKLAAEAESEMRREALDDLKFSIGEQWPADIKSQRELDGKPCLTINRLPQFIRQVTNEQRQQRPAAQINPVGDGADVDTAEIMQGMVRHVEVNSDADIADDTAFDHMVRIGFGYERLLTKYMSDDTRDQEIFIEPVENPFTVYFDPAASRKKCYENARWAFIVEDVPRADFVRDNPKSALASLTEFSSVGDNAPGWASKESIRVAEYFHIEESTQELVKLKDGTLIDAADFTDAMEAESRTQKTERKVMWAKITALDILDETEWPGKWIAIIPVLGEDLDVNGKRYLAGLVRHLKDPQRAFNYWKSAATQMIALAPQAPFLAAEGQLEGHEEEWRQMNRRNYPFLYYKAMDVGGKPVGPPIRNVVEPPIQAMNQMLMGAEMDMQAVSGIYEPTLGKQKQEQSGIAIARLQKQSNIGTLNFTDNLARSIRFRTRMLLDLFPKIYDTPRIQRIIAPDQQVSHVITHTGGDQFAAAQGMVTEKIRKVFDLSQGRYDVTVSVGPSYQSKRQEAVASQLELLKILPPQIAQNILDLITRNMDWPGASEIADRLKKMLPPQLQDESDTDPKVQLQQMQAQMQAMGQQHELLVKALNDATKVVETKQIEARNRLDIEKLKIEAQITIAEITTKSQEVQMRIKLEQDMFAELHSSAHERALQVGDQTHEKDMAAQAAAQQPTDGTQPEAGAQ